MKTLRLLIIIAIFLTVLSGCSKKESLNIKNIKDEAASVMNTDLMQEADEDLIEGMLHLEKTDYEDIVYLMPSMNVHASQILVVKVNKEQKDGTEKKIKSYLDNAKELFNTYLEEEYKLLEDAEFFTKDEFIILLVGENAQEARTKIEKLF